jgi:hypothetical protein
VSDYDDDDERDHEPGFFARNRWPLVVAGVLVLAPVLLLVAMFTFRQQAVPRDVEARAAAEVQEDARRSTVVKVVPAPAPEPNPDDAAFDAAFAKALEMSDRMDEQEPAFTAKRLAEMVRGDQEAVREDMAAIRQAPAESDKRLKTLSRLGFPQWAAKQSRKVAKADPRFRSVAKAFWKPGEDPQNMLARMNTWAAIPTADRDDIAAGVRAQKPLANLAPATQKTLAALEWSWPISPPARP